MKKSSSKGIYLRKNYGVLIQNYIKLQKEWQKDQNHQFQLLIKKDKIQC